MFTEFASAMQSLKVLTDLVSAAKSLSNYNELVTAVADVNLKLMQAMTIANASQEKQSQLLARIAELEAELAKVNDWELRKQCYRLQQFPTGASAYALQRPLHSAETMHYLCSTCFEKQHPSILQPAGGGLFLECNACKAKIQIKMAQQMQVVRRAPGRV